MGKKSLINLCVIRKRTRKTIANATKLDKWRTNAEGRKQPTGQRKTTEMSLMYWNSIFVMSTFYVALLLFGVFLVCCIPQQCWSYNLIFMSLTLVQRKENETLLSFLFLPQNHIHFFPCSRFSPPSFPFIICYYYYFHFILSMRKLFAGKQCM